MSAGGRSGGGLYTPAILGAAVSLVNHPFDVAMPYTGEARSRSCGSVISLSLDFDSEQRIARLGIKSHACAVGQAAAGLFADGAKGRTHAEIAAARAEIAGWLEGAGREPLWPGISLLASALPYPARHAAILLAWDAALAAMPNPSLEQAQNLGGRDG